MATTTFQSFTKVPKTERRRKVPWGMLSKLLMKHGIVRRVNYKGMGAIEKGMPTEITVPKPREYTVSPRMLLAWL